MPELGPQRGRREMSSTDNPGSLPLSLRSECFFPGELCLVKKVRSTGFITTDPPGSVVFEFWNPFSTLFCSRGRDRD